MLVSLAAFAGVAFLVYRLRPAVLLREEIVHGLEGRLEFEKGLDQDRIRHLQAELEAVKQEALRAADAEAKARGAHNPGPAGKDEKFSEARRAFARLYHPDNVKAGGLDKLIRAEIFKEYWSELEKIDKGGKK